MKLYGENLYMVLSTFFYALFEKDYSLAKASMRQLHGTPIVEMKKTAVKLFDRIKEAHQPLDESNLEMLGIIKRFTEDDVGFMSQLGIEFKDNV